ncbi:MAG: HEAT repeat domain-containing protein, partial [Bacteroidales bacterium]|nr:HEAT repeat domain-containing protein [Candidatus Latescibacterota bacterium]
MRVPVKGADMSMIMIESTLKKTIAVSLAVAFIIPIAAMEVRSDSKYASVLDNKLGRAKMISLAVMEQAGDLGEGIRGLIIDPDPLIRLRCAEVLGRVDDPLGTIYYLSRLCTDEDPDVQNAAVFSLGLAGHRKSTEQMTLESINGVLKSAPLEIKITALRALGLTKLRSASELIVPYLRNFNSSLRVEAVMALSVLGDSSSAEACLISIHDPAPLVVASAVYAMGRLGYCRANDEIIALLMNEDESVRIA